MKPKPKPATQQQPKQSPHRPRMITADPRFPETTGIAQSAWQPMALHSMTAEAKEARVEAVARVMWGFDHEKSPNDKGYLIMDPWRREQYTDCARAVLSCPAIALLTTKARK